VEAANDTISASVGMKDIYNLFSYSPWPIFMTLGEVTDTDTDKVMNPQHFWCGPADIQIRVTFG